jgi:hypothetical protein
MGARNVISHIRYSTLLALAGIFAFSTLSAQETEKKRYITPSENPGDVYWGDAHIHTRISVDSSLWGNTLGPADTYKYVRGGEVTSFKGWTVKLGRPLDWTIISDHSDVWGFFQLMEEGAPIVMAEPIANLVYTGVIVSWRIGTPQIRQAQTS